MTATENAETLKTNMLVIITNWRYQSIIEPSMN